jgi:ABC-type transporter Mla subunit MlaD
MVAGYNVGVVREIGRYRMQNNSQPAARPTTERDKCFERKEIMLEELLQTAAAGQTMHNPSIQFFATLAIDREWNREINRDSRVVLEHPSLLSGPVIGLRLAQGEQRLCAGSIIPLISEEDKIQSILSTVQQYLKQDLAQILAAADSTIGSIQQTLQRLDHALQSGDDTLRADDDNLTIIIKQSRRLIEELAGSAAQLNQLSEKVASDLIDQSKMPLTRIGTLASSLNKTTQSAPDVLAKTGALIEQTRQTMVRLNSLLAKNGPNIGAVTTELDYSLRLLSDALPGVLANLERATQNLAALFADLRASPAATLRGRGNETPQWHNDR